MRELTQVRFEREGAIARLTFDRPQQLNALSPTLISETLHVTQEVAASDARVFSAGVDLKATSASDFTREDLKTFRDEARAIGVLFETMSQVTIAQVTGHCYTGGLELALGCDFILASDEATFCDTHGKIGLTPGWGLSQRLPARIGMQRAKAMSFTARPVGAAEAVRIGLILEHVPEDGLSARVNEFAALVASMNANSITGYKALYRASQNFGLDEGLDFETSYRRPRGPEKTPPLSSYLKSSGA